VWLVGFFFKIKAERFPFFHKYLSEAGKKCSNYIF